MRNFVLMIGLLVVMATTTYGQEKSKMQYLLDGDVKVSGFGGPMVEFSTIKGELAVSNGGGGAVLLNNKFFFGAYGSGLSNRIQLDDRVGRENVNLNFGHGGFWTGYIHKPNDMLHFGGSLRAGWGHVDLNDRDSFGFPSSSNLLSDNVFVLIPQGEVEVNITRWFKVNAALGYRAVAGLNSEYMKSSELSSLNFSLGFLFGWYGR